MYKHILVPLDGSKLAEVALPHAVAQATQTGAAVTLLRAIPPLTAAALPEGAYIDWDRIRADMEGEAKTYLDGVSSRISAQGVQVRTELATGNPADIIIEAASRLGVDLIVMATHGRSGVGRWVMGSVADRVVRAATAPVLLIRPARMPED